MSAISITVYGKKKVDDILAQLHELLTKYDAVTVEDLHGLVGVNSTFRDTQVGWTNLEGWVVKELPEDSNQYIIETSTPVNFGELIRKSEPIQDLDIYIVFDMNADSWSGRRTMISIHQTLEGALERIPDNVKTPTYDRTEHQVGKDPYLKHFTYFAIEKRTIGA